jgi:hypothetical protein
MQDDEFVVTIPGSGCCPHPPDSEWAEDGRSAMPAASPPLPAGSRQASPPDFGAGDPRPRG